MARIYANENFRLSVVEILRKLGHDVLTTSEAGKASRRIPDDQVLAFAKAEKRIVLTYNRRHFFQLHRLDSIHFGIIACTEDDDLEAFARRIHDTIQDADGNLDNQLIRIIKPNPSKKL